ncbi:DUF4232 domain-containing protein [Streptomyces sp. NPDC047072]|uniref:DUF4232 domain-containing protein n=1 Tax=Streptomyces sp. NPDC047072 TaxID=3154809 RepID=UPI00340F02E6
MRAAPLTVTAVAAALLLTACSDGDKDSTADGSSASPKSGTSCTIDTVDLEVGPANVAPAAGDTGNIPVTLTNQSAKCTLEGFPTVDLNASKGSTSVTSDKAAQPQKLTLAKGDTATFTITYTRGKAGGADTFDAQTLNIALPGDGASKSYKWTYGPVQGESGNAEVLEASVDAFTQAAD